MVIYLIMSSLILLFFFFFQAEDGIRDIGVTGVQTCALPISDAGRRPRASVRGGRPAARRADRAEEGAAPARRRARLREDPVLITPCELRSEERRVGKECRSRWSPYH